MLLLLVSRHGETDYNIQKRYTGSTDVLLNPTGLSQAEKLSRNDRIKDIDLIVSSPLLRAVQTALAVQRETSKPLHIVLEFAERSFGAYEGLTGDEAKLKYPDLWEMNCLRQENLAPEGGETLREFTRRISRGLDYLRETYDGKKILLVSHGFAAREINRIYYNLTYAGMNDFTLDNGEVVEYCFQ